MKSYNEIEKKYSPEEMAESIVFPGTKDINERESVLTDFRDFRKKLTEKDSEKTKTISLLLQLKYSIEDYIESKAFNKKYFFGYFLKEYISSLDKKNNEFAAEIDIDPSELSQVINKHRKPTDKLIYRLEIHSNKNFPALMWFKLLEKDRAYELIHNKEMIEKEKKHVKRKLEFSF